MSQKTFYVEVYHDEFFVEASDADEAIELAKEAVFHNGLTISVEATIDEEDIARDQAGEEIEECEGDCIQWDIAGELLTPAPNWN